MLREPVKEEGIMNRLLTLLCLALALTGCGDNRKYTITLQRNLSDSETKQTLLWSIFEEERMFAVQHGTWWLSTEQVKRCMANFDPKGVYLKEEILKEQFLCLQAAEKSPHAQRANAGSQDASADDNWKKQGLFAPLPSLPPPTNESEMLPPSRIAPADDVPTPGRYPRRPVLERPVNTAPTLDDEMLLNRFETLEKLYNREMPSSIGFGTSEGFRERLEMERHISLLRDMVDNLNRRIKALEATKKRRK